MVSLRSDCITLSTFIKVLEHSVIHCQELVSAMLKPRKKIKRFGPFFLSNIAYFYANSEQILSLNQWMPPCSESKDHFRSDSKLNIQNKTNSKRQRAENATAEKEEVGTSTRQILVFDLYLKIILWNYNRQNTLWANHK